MHQLRQLFTALIAIALAAPIFAADPPKPDAKKTLPRWMQMDYGPFFSLSICDKLNPKFDPNTGFMEGDVVPRAIAIKLTDDWTTGVVFDTDLCRLAYAWTGARPHFSGILFDGGHGLSTQLATEPVFRTPIAPGWASAKGSFKDPRPDIIKPISPPGPLPREWAKYKGLYRHGEKVILSYTVGKTSVLEMPSLEPATSAKIFARTFHVEPSEQSMTLMVAQGNSTDHKITVVDAPANSKLETNIDNNTVFTIPPHSSAIIFKILVASPPLELSTVAKPIDLTTLIKGGPAQYSKPVITKGILSTASTPYVVDTITLPTENPWKSWIRPGGFDFFADGSRAAICTWSGDVWIVSGLDDKLEKITWKRFATGLHQPLGLKIVDEKIYTVGHDQITRFHDLNNDGEADFYENFNNDWELTSAFHAFAFDLNIDREGNFFFAFGSPVRPGGGGFQSITNHHGSILKVSKDGSKLEVYATGFRAPNGMSVGPSNQVTIADNEGSWVPKTPLHWIKQGSFNGVVTSAHMPLKSTDQRADPSEMPKPICWLPKHYDNSNGSQVWVTSDRWGPFAGDLLHLSYGSSSLFKVFMEEVNGQMQGGVIKFPLKFTSSAMRGRFNPRDGQLYITGLFGWQSNAAKDGGFDRVRYTGKLVNMPTSVRVTTTGLQIKFTEALDLISATNPDNYSVEVWNYKWSSAYGSADYSTVPETDAKEKKKGDVHDTLDVKKVYISASGHAVVLEVDGIKPVHQMRIAMKIKAYDGTPIHTEIYNTIHNVSRN